MERTANSGNAAPAGNTVPAGHAPQQKSSAGRGGREGDAPGAWPESVPQRNGGNATAATQRRQRNGGNATEALRH